MVSYGLYLFSDHRHNEGQTALPKLYVCRYCKKTFPYATSLRKHEMIHTGEKPYSCEICGKSFSQKENMKSHQMTHLKIG